MKDCRRCPMRMPEMGVEGTITGFQILVFVVLITGFISACNSVELTGDADDLERDTSEQASEEIEVVTDANDMEVIQDDPIEETFPEDLSDASDDAEAREECVPTCDGRECGNDGCGGSCGACPERAGCDIWAHCHACGEMVLVPAGDFVMGTEDADLLALSNTPQHIVFISNYLLDVCEVTNEQWRNCVADGGCSPPAYPVSHTRLDYYDNAEYNEYPVLMINWFQAFEYCSWIGKRLPTEAEWEKAARGGCDLFGDPVSCTDMQDKRMYPWGDDDPSCDLADFCSDDTSLAGSHPGGASPYGLLNFADNVAEWVFDWDGGADYFETGGPPWIDPQGPNEGSNKVIKGGYWYGTMLELDLTSRILVSPYWYDFYTGLRCASN